MRRATRPASTTPVIVTGMISPANETPEEPSATAQPRRTTNHFATVTFATSGPTSENPMPLVTTESAMNCHSSWTRDMARKALR